jgi:HTH domain
MFPWGECMNKLAVTIKLLQLINERKIINSKIIANELNVSLRTAQRYLQELSSLPCLVNQGNSSNYELYPDYKLKDALLNTSVCDIVSRKLTNYHKSTSMREVSCLICGMSRDKIAQHIFLFNDNDVDNEKQFEQLATTIKDLLTSNQCSFPEK